jgi:hypothetical protein
LKIWSDEDITSEEDNEDDDISHHKDSPKTKFGPIPRFSRVYEVKVSANTNLFGCSCYNQERMGMPCCHIASVCLDNETILGIKPQGFPLSSVRIFWWNQYYLYGLSNKKDHQKSKQALITLATNDIAPPKSSSSKVLLVSPAAPGGKITPDAMTHFL